MALSPAKAHSREQKPPPHPNLVFAAPVAAIHP
jgi:hypothetical protein